MEITEIELGEGFPRLGNCRIVPRAADGQGEGGEGEGGVEARMEVEAGEGVFGGVGVRTGVRLGWGERGGGVCVPVGVGVRVVRFRGVLCVGFSSSPSSASAAPSPVGAKGEEEEGGGMELSVAFLRRYELGLETRSLVGSRSKLQDLPKVKSVVEARVRAWFEERWVLPGRRRVRVPSLWPRNEKVVERGTEGEGREEGRGGLGKEEGREGEGEGERKVGGGMRWRGERGLEMPGVVVA